MSASLDANNRFEMPAMDRARAKGFCEAVLDRTTDAMTVACIRWLDSSARISKA